MKIGLKLKTLYRFWEFRLRSEKDSIRFMLSQNLSGTTTLDIGANKGVYTYWMSKAVGKRGKVISFEPQPELGAFLQDVKTTFKLHNLEIVNKGLSSTTSEIDLYRKKVGDGGARLEPEANKTYSTEGWEKVKVKVVCLDDIIKDKNISELSFIKCDVEGHELEVFRGAIKTLKKYQPTILFECHHEEALEGTVFSLLEDIGYTGFFFNGTKKLDARNFHTVPYPRMDNHRNYVFIKRQ